MRHPGKTRSENLRVCNFHFVHSRLKDEKVYPVATRKALTSSATNSSSNHVLKQVTMMMAFASLILILRWLPNQIYFLFSQLGYFELKPGVLVTVVGVLVFSNSFMSPIIYASMNESFKYFK